MAELHGSGGSITAHITREQEIRADLKVGKLFLAPLGRIPESNITAYHCKNCQGEFSGPPDTIIEESNVDMAENLTLVERGRYECKGCGSVIGEYRDFRPK